MFGSGSKKQDPSKLPQAVLLLTRDYLISGKTNPVGVFDHPNLFDQLKNLSLMQDIAIYLSDAQVQPTGSLVTPSESFARFRILEPDSILAAIPGDEHALQVAMQTFKNHSYALPVVIFAGNYHIRGQLMTEDQDGTNYFGAGGQPE